MMVPRANPPGFTRAMAISLLVCLSASGAFAIGLDMGKAGGGHRRNRDRVSAAWSPRKAMMGTGSGADPQCSCEDQEQYEFLRGMPLDDFAWSPWRAAPQPVVEFLSDFKRLIPDLRHKVMKHAVGPAMHNRHETGILPSESLALIAAIKAARVEVFFESGTAGGFSTEVLARYFEWENNPLKIYTMDMNKMRYRTGSGEFLVDETQRRLQQWRSVEALSGNSFDLIPKLMAKHRGQRMAVFVDGPKRAGAAQLCFDAMRQFQEIVFCGIHDTSKVKRDHVHDGYIQKMDFNNRGVRNWGRTIFMTDEFWWRTSQADLDREIPGEPKIWSKKIRREDYPMGFGVSLIAGPTLMEAELVCKDERFDRKRKVEVIEPQGGWLFDETGASQLICPPSMGGFIADT